MPKKAPSIRSAAADTIITSSDSALSTNAIIESDQAVLTPATQTTSIKSEAPDTPTMDIYGARAHNLKGIDLSIPRGKLVVFSGLSGSGKSSLAFDTIYAEGQRRYMESFSAYARQFIGGLERPEVDKIEGLSPVISIEQKTTSRNPRSTVGTVTEVYDFMRLLFARVADAYSADGQPLTRMSDDQIRREILKRYAGQRFSLLAPIIRARKGHYREQFEQIRKQGYLKVRVDGVVVDITPKMQVDRYKTHDIEIVIDRIELTEGSEQRLTQSLQTALKVGKGVIMVLPEEEAAGANANPSKRKKGETGPQPAYFSKHLMDPLTGQALDDPQPNTFSFNTPYGACPKCNGLGVIAEIDLTRVMPDQDLSINRGGLKPLGEFRDVWIFKILRAIAKRHNFSLADPISTLNEEAMKVILEGTVDEVKVVVNGNTYHASWEGVLPMLRRQFENSVAVSEGEEIWREEFLTEAECDECLGARIKPEGLMFKLGGKHISNLAQMDLNELEAWYATLAAQLTERQVAIGGELIKEIKTRLGFLTTIGLGYLTLHRGAGTLSGGEAQRIRLATQIGSQLVGVTYILDEPSIGLHQRDNQRLIESLHRLRDLGNSVLVVEHDKDMMEQADYVVDVGPGAGIHGGHIVGEGTPDVFREMDTLTADYLAGRKTIAMPEKRRTGNGHFLKIKGATGHNLKNVTLELPLGTFICVTGVSGSGKSSLIGETLYPILNQYIYKSIKRPLAYAKVEGLELLDKVIEIDQSPIGRTPRSNPATYTDLFSPIRNLFSMLQEAKVRGYKPGRFSFNVKGGRCETCGGAGVRVVEMKFLPDVQVLCETCHGRRYNRETLEVRYRGKSINDVLNLSVEDALTFFENVPQILRKVQTLADVGLGYLTLGQPSTTLSGGEAQRVKLATELSKRDTGRTIYILDEPTTGLHFEDIRVLLDVLQRLVDRGNTVLVVEHNLDVIKCADHVIDLGPEGGAGGGEILFAGTPEALAKQPRSHTGQYLVAEMS